MKNKTLIVLSFCVFLFIGCNSCSTNKGQLNPVTGIYDTNVMASAIVVTAEKLRESALDIFDLVMKTERENETALKVLNPKIHETVELIRRDSAGWLNRLTAAKVAYQNNRNSENITILQTEIAKVTTNLSNATQLLTSMKVK